MKHKKPQVEIDTYGEYESWDRESKEIPRILDIKNEIKALPGTEFGYVLRIRKGKGEKLTFRIDHPPFNDDTGKIAPPFAGEHYIRTNDYKFFLGDGIWEPVEDKKGEWILTTFHHNKIIAKMAFTLV